LDADRIEALLAQGGNTMPDQIRTAMVGTNADGAYSTSLGQVWETDRDPASFADPALGNNETAGINLGGLVPFARVVDGVSTGISVGGTDSTSDIVYSGTYVNGIVLSDPATQNPATVAATAYVTNNTPAFNGDAIYGMPGSSWTLANLGTITSTGSYSNGVHLTAGGSVTNGQSGAITGETNGVDIGGSSGTVVNFGTIQARAVGYAYDYFGYRYTIGIGQAVHLEGAGGSVTNGQSGSTAGLITGTALGVDIGGGSGTVTNFGTIEGAVWIRGGTGTVTNLGTMSFVLLLAGGSVTNGQSGSSGGLMRGVEIYGSGAVTNFSLIDGGVALKAGGSVTNSNSGLIDGGVVAAGGSVANFGTINGHFAGFGASGSSVINGQSGSTGGLITAFQWGVVGGTVTNFGTIESTGSFPHVAAAGVLLPGGGSVANFGMIRAAMGSAGIGIALYDMPEWVTSAATVTNSGTIIGNRAAVLFGSGDDLLVVDPGAVFIGKVDGGGGNNTLELAAGTGAGTLGGLGTSFVNFGSVVFDANAAWTVGLDNPAAFTGTISGFASGDFLDLTGRAANSVSYSGGVLTVFNDASVVATLHLVGSYTSADFTLTPDGLSGTDIGIGSSGPLAVTGPPSATMNGATGSSTTSPATTGTPLGADTAPAAASDGVTSAPVALFGQFVAAGFHAAADSSGLGSAVDHQQHTSTPVLASPLHH
jgi:hypothetical protein